MPGAGGSQGRRTRLRLERDGAHRGDILPNLPGTANGVGVLVKLRRDSADGRRTSGRCGRGSIVATVREGPEAVWLRVGDVANRLGVSPNTVRRWTDVGRIAAHRSPGGHRRYLADDVLALLPQDESEGTAQPGDFADLRRQTQDLRFTLQAGLDLMSLLAEDPHAVPAETARILCGLTGAPHCDVYFTDGDKLRLAVSLDGGELDSGRLGAAWTTADWAPVDGDPASAPVTCLQATDKGLTRRARLAMQRRGCRSLAWAPAGAARQARRGDRAQRRGRPRLLPARRRGRGPRTGVRRGGRDQAHGQTSSHTATRACASWSSSRGRSRRPTISSGSSCASRSGC